MATYATARSIALDIAQMVRPPRRISVAEGARALKVVTATGAGEPWDAETTPYIVKPLNATASRRHEAVVLIGPARSGKTLGMIEGRLAHTIANDPADAMVIQSTKDAAEDYSKTRIRRAIRESPGLHRQLSPRAHDDNVLMKFFRPGNSLRIGWPSLSVLSGKDVKVMLMTDVDNFTGDLSIDEAFGYGLKRIQTFMSGGIVVAESSPAKDYTDGNWRPDPKHPHMAPPAAGICSLYNRGDRHRWYWPCMECKQYFQASPGYDLFRLPPEKELLERVKTDDILWLARRYSILFCPNCHAPMEHRWKPDMNLAGDWVGEGQVIHEDGSIEGDLIDSKTTSYYLGGCAAAFQSWESLIERLLQGLKAYATTSDEKALKATYNVDGAIPYVPWSARSDNDPSAMQARAESWPMGVVPEGVRFLIGTVDVQGTWFAVQITGFGVGSTGELERWIVDRYALRTSRREDGSGGFLGLEPPKYLEDWNRLIEKVIDRRYPLADGSGRTMPVRAVGIDSGGKAGTTTRAYEFWRKLKAAGLGWKVRLIKGKGDDTKLDPNRNRDWLFNETRPDQSKRKDRNSGAVGDVPLLRLNVDKLKDTVSTNVQRAVPGVGYYHFPDWLPTSFYEELTAETRTADGWRNLSGRRNESGDLTAYAEGLVLWMKVPAIKWDQPPPWAHPWDTNPDVAMGDDPAPPPPPTPRRKPVRVIRSKYLGR